jgi:hypothetical protein
MFLRKNLGQWILVISMNKISKLNPYLMLSKIDYKAWNRNSKNPKILKKKRSLPRKNY